MLSALTPQQFSEIKQEEMSLIHHVAVDGNIQLLKMLATLPYYRDIIDDDSNEVKM